MAEPCVSHFRFVYDDPNKSVSNDFVEFLDVRFSIPSSDDLRSMSLHEAFRIENSHTLRPMRLKFLVHTSLKRPYSLCDDKDGKIRINIYAECRARNLFFVC